MTRQDPLKLHSGQPHTQPRLFTGATPSQLEQETQAEQERRAKEAEKDKETGSLFK